MNMDDITSTIIPLLKEYGVKKAALFGSYARGDYDEKSDVDILIEPPEEMGLEFVDLKLNLEDKLHKKVDLVSYNGISRYLKKYILSQQVQLL
jgi:predicted nucleotidyltransferase